MITHDRRTMTRHLLERLAVGKRSPGLFIVPRQSPIGEIVEWLLLVWTASQAEEWRDQIVYLPFPVKSGVWFRQPWIQYMPQLPATVAATLQRNT